MTDKPYRIAIHYHSANPILNNEDISVQRLVSFLNLETERVIELLEYDMIELDMFNQICVSKTRGTNYYPMTSTTYHVYPNPARMDNVKIDRISQDIFQKEIPLDKAISELRMIAIADKKKIVLEVTRLILSDIDYHTNIIANSEDEDEIEMSSKRRSQLRKML